MSDHVPVSDPFMQDLAYGRDDWETTMPDWNDDWSKFIDFDAPRAQPMTSADYDAQGGLDPDFGSRSLTSCTPTYAPGTFGWDPATLYGPHTGMGLSPATGTRGSASNEPTNDAYDKGYDTNLLATESETVPSHNAGMLDSENSLEDPAVPKSSSKDETWLGITDDNAAPSSDKTCKCIVCLKLGNEWELMRITNASGVDEFLCRLPACPYVTEWYSNLRLHNLDVCNHEKEHFRHEGQFICAETHCSYSATRWADLKRHYTSKHCMSPKTKFPCPELSCTYSGENGFLRKDKMKSHYQTVHGGKANPGKPFQAIQPKTGSAA